VVNADGRTDQEHVVVKLRRARRAAGALAVIGAVLVTGACQGVSLGLATDNAAAAPTTAGPSTTATPTPTPSPAELTVTPADKARGVLPTAPISVKADVGTLDEVVVADDKGKTVKGKLDASGAWKSAAGDRLRPSTTYTITSKATGPDGTPSTTKSTFTTLKPKVTATYGILNSGMTVGVGMPVSIQFDSAVATPELRAQVEKLVSVKTVPKQNGAWGWLDNRQLMWRPADYWVPGTKVSVNAPLTGIQTGADKWVANDDAASFTVGSSMVSTVDMKAHTMTVRRGGQVVKVIPVSTGKPGPKTETRSGTKVIIRKEGEVTMDSTTVGIPKGDPDYYKIDTKWNLRVTWTGEYLHSAPWSVGAQGSANVSHGCVNMAPENARWMFENSKVGDVVKFTGSGRQFQPHEGIGVWVYDFAGWKTQSALR
jgi:lipoprotein-anchoring transpeptidase ErfK/SrfK